MKLAVFDIDGTLTLGDGLGTRCFFAALEGTFGSGPTEPRLDFYAESTDGGIAAEAAAAALGRPASATELDTFKSCYLRLLESRIAEEEAAYRPVAGAGDFLAFLSVQPGWRVAIATGNWRRAAMLKLACAGLSRPPVSACSEDGVSRSEVLSAAIAASSRQLPVGGEFERVVYVGDQPWDLRAAAEVGVAFLGVASQARASKLEGEGVCLTESFSDRARVLALLDDVSVAAPGKRNSRSRTSGPFRSACGPG